MAKYKCNIGKYLESKGITQRELAEAIGTTEVSVSRYVNGDRIPKATTCIEIAKVLDCEFEDLYSVENPKQRGEDMTEQEAIKTLEDLQRLLTNYRHISTELTEANGMAIKALEKQVPKKPNGIHCGSCNYVLVLLHDLYCPRCGQKIDWT